MSYIYFLCASLYHMPQGLQVCWWAQTSGFFCAQQRDTGHYKSEGTFQILNLEFGMQICCRFEDPS